MDLFGDLVKPMRLFSENNIFWMRKIKYLEPQSIDYIEK